MSSKSVFLIIVVICLSLFIYIANPSKFYFLNDDSQAILLVKNFHFSPIRPVSDITLFADYLIWGNHSIGYHLTNLLLHLVTTLLVYLLAKKIFLKFNDDKLNNYKTLLAALLFLFYPFHSEAIFWIIGRGGILGALFGISSLILYLNRGKGIAYLIFSILLFLIGALSYEAAWIVPVVLIIVTAIEVKLQPEHKKLYLKQIFIFWFFFLSYLLIREIVTGDITGSPYGSPEILKMDLKLWIKNYNIMLARSFLPPMRSNILQAVLYGTMVIGGILFFRRQILQKRLSYSMQITVAALLISFLPFLTLGVDSHDSESERFLYFPSVFAILLLSEVVFEMLRLNWQRILIFSLLLLAEIFYLSRSAVIYQSSSSIASVSMIEMSKIDSNSNIFCVDIPTQYQGGFIFRTGFKESAEWLAGKNKKMIAEISKKEIINPSFPYLAERFSFSQLPAATRAFVLQQLSQNHFITAKDVVLRWTDSSLQILHF